VFALAAALISLRTANTHEDPLEAAPEAVLDPQFIGPPTLTTT
jgi:hypothetical protein